MLTRAQPPCLGPVCCHTQKHTRQQEALVLLLLLLVACVQCRQASAALRLDHNGVSAQAKNH